MAATQTLVSLEEYLHTRYRPDCDYIDGHLEPRRPGENNPVLSEEEWKRMGEFQHNRLQALITAWFIAKESDWNICTVTEQRMHVSPDDIRVCDVVLLRADAPREEVTLTPPLLCIEILSPEDRIPRAQKVLEDYRAMGVSHSWLLDPIRRIAYTFDDNGLHLHTGDRLELPGSPVHIVLSSLFARIN